VGEKKSLKNNLEENGAFRLEKYGGWWGKEMVWVVIKPGHINDTVPGFGKAYRRERLRGSCRSGKFAMN